MNMLQTGAMEQRTRARFPSSRHLGSLVDLYWWTESMYRLSVLARRVRLRPAETTQVSWLTDAQVQGDLVFARPCVRV